MTLPSSLFTTELFWSALKWLMILLVWAVFAVGTWREDRKLNLLLQKPLPEQDMLSLLRTLHRRDMQIWRQLTLLLIVVAVLDIHHSFGLLPEGFFTAPPPAPPVAALKSEEAPVAADEKKYDKALKNSGAPGLPFSEITTFNEKDAKREAYIDWLKERYEAWFVTYFYLQKCHAVPAGDYDLIQSSLHKELSGAHADPAVEGNILVAASGSYKEMYSDIQCDGSQMTATKATYDANMQQIKAQPAQRPVATAPKPTNTTGSSR